MLNKTPQSILTRRDELKKEIAEMLEETNSYFGVDDVINAVYEEEESDDYQHIIAMFDDGNIDNLSNVLELATDVWNYFPHKALGGLSPAEKSLEPQKTVRAKKSNQKSSMPRVQVGDYDMSWEDYEKMLQEMERQQVPFKKWIEGVLPEYESHLKNTEKLPKDIVQKHRFIAEMFFDRVLHVGFLDFGGIRPEFIDKEFLIFTGDGDFDYLIKKIVEKGTKVYVVSSNAGIKKPGLNTKRLSTRIKEVMKQHEQGKIDLINIDSWKMKIQKEV
jgi:hypothetical protein